MGKKILSVVMTFIMVFSLCRSCCGVSAGDSIPAFNLLGSSYSIGSWRGGGAAYIEGGMAQYGEDNGYDAVIIEASKTAVFDPPSNSQFRLQLDDTYFPTSSGFVAGDRIYFSFMAKAESADSNSCNGSFYISTVKRENNSTVGSISNTAKFTFSDEWTHYSGFVDVKSALSSDVYARARLDVGYKGQKTYLADFKMYKCLGTDDEVREYVENPPVINMVKTQEIITAGAGSGDTSRCIYTTETVYDTAVHDDFVKTFKFTSSEYNNTENTSNDNNKYKARFQTLNIDSSSVNVGDKLLFAFWAKGEYTGDEEGMTARMRPDLQASMGGSGGKSVNRINENGQSDKTVINVAEEWKRYGCIFVVPESDGKDMQINWHIGSINQSITFAKPELYNLGSISVAEAFSYLDDMGHQFIYRGNSMEQESETLYSARAPIGVYAVNKGDFSVVTSHEFVDVKIDNAPHVGTEYGMVTVTAPNGRSRTAIVKIYSYADYEERKPKKGFVMNDDGSVSFGISFGVRSNVDAPKYYAVAVGEYDGARMTSCNFDFVEVPSAGEYSGEISLAGPADSLKHYKAYAVEIPSLKPVGKYCMYEYMPAELIAEEFYDFGLVHNKLKNETGIPAIIEPGDIVPKFFFNSDYNCTLEYTLTLNGNPLCDSKVINVQSGTPVLMDISDYISLSDEGEYKISIKATSGSVTLYDALYFYVADWSKRKSDDSKLVYMADNGSLTYIPDYKGNKIMDFSAAGYKNGSEPIPDVQAKITVSPSGGDDTSAIQQAIDYVASLPKDSNGIRGAVKLSKGVFRVSSKLSITSDGVMLSGSGNDNPNITDAVPTGDANTWAKANAGTDGTIVLLTSKEAGSRMLDILGSGGAVKVSGTEQKVISEYVPAGSREVRVENASSLKVGDDIIIEQYGNLAWVHEIGMDAIPPRETVDANVSNNSDSGINQWKAQKWIFERKITAIDGNVIYLDIPVAASIERKWGGAVVYKYTDSGRISNIGIENMRVVAAWTPNSDGVDDTRHAGELVTIKNAKDVWVKNITTEHLFLYNINIHKSSKCITVEDFYNLIAPKSYYKGNGYDSSGRTFFETGVYVGRYGIYIGGQQVLMQRVYGINNRHLVEYQNLAAGPNVAVDCISKNSLTQMGPHMGWSVGGLYDNIDGAVHIQNRLNMGSGHGWAGAWYTAWNCTGQLAVQKPPTAQNYSVGHTGNVHLGDYSEFEQGYRDLQGIPSNIQSLYEAQVNERG